MIREYYGMTATQTYGDSVGADVKPDCRHPRLTLKANSEGI